MQKLIPLKNNHQAPKTGRFDKNISPRLAERSFLALPLYHQKGKAQGFSTKANGLVVQLVRMPPCHGGGRGFESRPDRYRL